MRALPPKGVLHFDQAMRHLRISRCAPAADLLDVVECHWEVAWDLPEGAFHRQRNLSHASVTLAWETDGAWIYGVPTRVFAREATGAGRVFGTKLRSGALRAFFPVAVAANLAGARLSLEPFLPAGFRGIEPLRECGRFEERVAKADDFCRCLRRQVPVPRSVALAADIEKDRSLLRVETLAERAKLSVRDLQRMFRVEVGLTPKETIRRFRLQQAADRFHQEPDISCLALALELGYFDQAHFAREFRSVVGTSPDAYRKRIRAARSVATDSV